MTPNREELAVPFFESEVKKAQVKVFNKVQSTPMVEGTSVMPRQRPKGSSATPLNLNNIPLTLSPSPTIKKSQSPITQLNFQPNITNPPNFQTLSTTSSEYSPNQSAFFPPAQKPPSKHLDSLFQSSIYPDPFRDDLSSSPTNDTNSGNKQETGLTANNVISPTSLEKPLFTDNLNQISQGKGLTESSNYVGATLTPPSTPTLAVPKGHRRNMSDTTAFNKLVLLIFCYQFYVFI